MENKRALITLLISNVVSGFATGISMLAIPWYFTINGMASEFGVLYAVVTFVSLFWNIYAGTLIDRYSRKKIFIWISLICCLVLSLSGGYGLYHGETPLLLVGLVFVTTIFNYNIHFGALYAFSQEITPSKHYGKISSYLEIQNQSTSVLSGGVAALLLSGIVTDTPLNLIGFNLKLPFTVEAWDIHDIFLLDAVTYAISIMLVASISYRPLVKRNAEQGNVIERLCTGYSFLRSNPGLFRFGIFSYAIFVVLLVEVFLLLPIYVDNHLESNADVYASSEVLYSIGALLAGISIRRLFSGMDSISSIIVLMVITTIIFYSVSFTKLIWVFYVFSFLIGITNAGTRVLRTTYIFNHVSNNVIGRTNGIFNMTNILMRSIFISIFAVAWFSEGSNITWAYFICGTFVLLSSVPLILQRCGKSKGRS